MQLISPRVLKERLCGSEEHAILDLRREGDFAKGHLFFACNVPRSVLELRIEQLIPRLDIPIAIVEADDYVEEIEDILAAFGYADVCFLDGGNDGWTASGGQLYSGVNVPSKAFGEFVELSAGTPHVSSETLERLLRHEPDAVIFDARPFTEFKSMSIPGALNCPGAELVYRFFENVPSDKTKVFVNCAGRTRSIIGAQSLIDAGIPNSVVALRDGTMGWRLAGFALQHGANSRANPPTPDALSRSRERAAMRARMTGVITLTSKQCGDLLRDDYRRTTYIFDVREPEEYQAGHRTQAICAPGGQLVQTLDSFAAVRNARFILCDSDGVRAPMTASWLKKMGHRDVYVVMDVSPSALGPPSTPKLERLLARAQIIHHIDAQEAMATGTAAIFDLGSSKEYRSSHILGAQFVERHEVGAAVAALPASQIAIITSSDGRLARIVALDFAARGERALALEGGTDAWRVASLPVESGAGNLPTQPDDVFYRPYDLDAEIEKAMLDYLEWEKGLVHRLAREPGVSFVPHS